jgi:hypothetical protein
MPNARGEPPPEAGARHERTLEAVGSSAVLGWDVRQELTDYLKIGFCLL